MTRESLMLRADKMACQLYNFTSRITNPLSNVEKNALKKNIELKGIGKGRPCFIFGNGPSLNSVDPKILSGYTTFTVNYFFKGSVKLEPTYHVMIDSLFFEKEFDYLQQLVREHKNTTFILPTEIMKNSKYDNFTEEEKSRIIFVQVGLKTYSEYMQFDMSQKMTVSMNVLPFAIQCALHMGFSKIYLMGYEFGLYAPVATGHFYNPAHEVTQPSDTAENLLRGAIVQRHNWAIAQYCKNNGIEIFNLTPESYIKAYQMRDYFETIELLEKGER